MYYQVNTLEVTDANSSGIEVVARSYEIITLDVAVECQSNHFFSEAIVRA